jgi:hypothetical protein
VGAGRVRWRGVPAGHALAGPAQGNRARAGGVRAPKGRGRAKGRLESCGQDSYITQCVDCFRGAGLVAKKGDFPRTTHSGKTGKIMAVGSEMQRGGREIWRFSSDGEVHTVITTGTSTKAMDRAASRFAPALKRLADR